MKKIILAFDGSHYSEGALELASRLNELSPVLLVGVFLPQAELANYYGYSGHIGGSVLLPLQESESDVIEDNIARFEKHCISNNIDFRIHRDADDFAMRELKKESLYTDLMILGTEVFFRKNGAGSPNEYLKEVLHDICCPVLLVPEKFDFPESIILTYDGSEDSVYAIKQFAYLFPELTSKETLLVFASSNSEEDFPDKVQIEELTSRHFTDLTLYKLEFDPKRYFSTWITEKKSVMLVTGSYGRSGWAQLFHKSFIEEILADHRLPVFIAHR